MKDQFYCAFILFVPLMSSYSLPSTCRKFSQVKGRFFMETNISVFRLNAIAKY